MIRFHLTGVEEFKAGLAAARDALPELARKAVGEFSGKTRDFLVGRIRSGSLPNVRITQSTLNKRQDPASPPLIDTKEYVDNIGVTNDGMGVGLLDQALEKRATALEFGTSKMTAKPHWRVAEAWAAVNVEAEIGPKTVDVLAEKLAGG